MSPDEYGSCRTFGQYDRTMPSAPRDTLAFGIESTNVLATKDGLSHSQHRGYTQPPPSFGSGMGNGSACRSERLNRAGTAAELLAFFPSNRPALRVHPPRRATP